MVERFKFSHSVYAHNNGFLLTPQKSLRYERIILEPTERGKMPSGSSFILLSERSEARLKKLSRWKYSKMQNTADYVGALQKKKMIF